MQKVGPARKPMFLLECKTLHHPKELILKYAKPGQQRRSLLGMIGTTGEHSFCRFIERAMRKEGTVATTVAICPIWRPPAVAQ